MFNKIITPIAALMLITSMIFYFVTANANAVDPELEKAVKRHEIMLNAMIDYIGKLQEKKILPNGNELDKK